MIDYQIHKGYVLDMDTSVHVCPICWNKWMEASNKDFYPNFCPGCGAEYDVNQEPMEWPDLTAKPTAKTVCPICGEECDTIYRSNRYGDIVGCDSCVYEVDACEDEDVNPDSYEKGERR